MASLNWMVRLYLVEMKWWEKPIGRQEIAPHLVSVYGRGDVRWHIYLL